MSRKTVMVERADNITYYITTRHSTADRQFYQNKTSATETS